MNRLIHQSNLTKPPTLASQLDYPKALLGMAVRYPLLWLAPLAVTVVLGLLFALFGQKQWRSTQALLVREQLIGRIVGPGRFDSLDTMKTVQETVQEIARHPAVIRRTLLTVGPAKDQRQNAAWPSEEDIEDLQGAISFFAPNGAEFGKTEILNMSVLSSSRDRARALTVALFDELQSEIRRVRQERAASMQEEIEMSVGVAQRRLDETARRLNEIETAVGEDLIDLRGLNDPGAGGGDLREIYTQILAELRTAKAEAESHRQQHEHLTKAAGDTTQLLATPRELLELQPALARLKDKLIDAQIHQSTLEGRFSTAHPIVHAAINSVDDIKNKIDRELAHQIPGLEAQIRLASAKVENLEDEANDINTRLRNLAEMRVSYGGIVDEMRQREADLASSQKELSQAESILKAATDVDFVAAIDQPQVGTRPEGPSKKLVVGGAGLAGAFIGLGLLMMLTPMPEGPAVPANTPEPLTQAQPAASTEIRSAEQPHQTDHSVQWVHPPPVMVSEDKIDVPECPGPEERVIEQTYANQRPKGEDERAAVTKAQGEKTRGESSPVAGTPIPPSVFVLPDLSQEVNRDKAGS